MLQLAKMKQLVEEELLPGNTAEDSPWLVDIELSGDGKGRVIRFLVDTDAGIKVEQLTAVARGIGALLDQEDLVPFAYRLEVCSPGLKRSLQTERQFRKAVGKELKFRWRAVGDSGLSELKAEGRLLEVREEELLIEGPKGQLSIPRDTLEVAVYKLNW